MKLFILLLVSFLEANPSHIVKITPGDNNIFSQEQAKVIIQQGNPLSQEQEPIVVFSEKQWMSLSEESEYPTTPIITWTQSIIHFGSFDLHQGYYPASQLSGFVQ